MFCEPFGVLIALGLVSQLLCYFGWTSTSKKHRCYLGTFSAFLVILIVAQFLISGWAIATKTQLITPAELAIEANFGQFIALDGVSNDQTHIWNRLQRDIQCCGVNGIHDYKKVGVPWSCYDPINSKVYSAGCMHMFVKSIEVNMIRVALVAIAAALIQSLGIFCVIQLVMLLKKPKLMLPIGDNHSLRVKRTRELVPLSSETATTSSAHAHTMASTIPTMPMPTMSIHSSTKPPIAAKPIVPKIEHPIIK
ncbi:tetraspanin-3 isoform X2 [Sabethes cyaneus]|nr:tetraspanin-3 isoform X2 [Sabethes cyaneus]XP_053687552.1 tetraspanin-3 isoform X2 [Sabethes cyaneus]